jgi:hypothetical protein
VCFNTRLDEAFGMVIMQQVHCCRWIPKCSKEALDIGLEKGFLSALWTTGCYVEYRKVLGACDASRHTKNIH